MASETERRPAEDTVVVDSDRLAADDGDWPVAELYRLDSEPGDDPALVPDPGGVTAAVSEAPARRRGRRVVGLLLALAVASAALLVAAALLSSRDGRSSKPAASTTPPKAASAGRTSTGKVTTVPLAPLRVDTQPEAVPPPPTKAAADTSVPSVVGRRASDASTALRRAGLRVQVRLAPSDGTAGIVTGQSPAAGAEAAPGTTVQLEVSKARPADTRVEIPDVVGLDIGGARDRLGRLGLTVEVKREASSEPMDTVLRQSPRPAALVEKRGVVTLTISSGPETVAVPDVVGLDEASAQAQLEDAGLAVRVTYQPTSDPSADGIVVAQMPAASASVSPDGEVTIVVARLA
jgi:serine/threonine-protein kinase